MKPVVLISCGKEKRQWSCRASEMYCSERFISAKQFAQQQNYDWYVISAKHGLLHPDAMIEPYDLSILNFTDNEKNLWAEKITNDIFKLHELSTKIMILADNNYSNALAYKLNKKGYSVILPFNEIDYTQQKNFLQNANDKIDKVKQLYDVVYYVANKTSGIRLLSECTGKMDWPKKGLYYILDFSEYSIAQNSSPKIIRVGTHAVSQGSKSTLWNRLKTHKGLNNGGGSHRSSVFRLHIGNAIIAKNGLNIPTWAVGQNATKEIRDLETDLEKQVSEYIGKLGVVVLNIDDQSSSTSDRAYIEKNSIALLSTTNYSFDFATMDWLGYYSNKDEIRRSSLWNINYVNNSFDNNFFSILEKYSDITINKYFNKE